MTDKNRLRANHGYDDDTLGIFIFVDGHIGVAALLYCIEAGSG